MNERDRAKEIGLKIKMRRIEKGINQYDLADSVGLKNTDISNYENGRTMRIPTESFLKICKVLELQPEFLDSSRFGGKETQNGLPLM